MRLLSAWHWHVCDGCQVPRRRPPDASGSTPAAQPVAFAETQFISPEGFPGHHCRESGESLAAEPDSLDADGADVLHPFRPQHVPRRGVGQWAGRSPRSSIPRHWTPSSGCAVKEAGGKDDHTGRQAPRGSASGHTLHGTFGRRQPVAGWQGRRLPRRCRAAQKDGVKLGVYLSPADLYQLRTNPTNPAGYYGNSSPKVKSVDPYRSGELQDRSGKGRTPPEGFRSYTYEVDDYNRYFLNQLYELLTEYGPSQRGLVRWRQPGPKRQGNL